MDFNARGAIGAGNREKYIAEHGGSFVLDNHKGGGYTWVGSTTKAVKPKVVKPVVKPKVTTKKTK